MSDTRPQHEIQKEAQNAQNAQNTQNAMQVQYDAQQVQYDAQQMQYDTQQVQYNAQQVQYNAQQMQYDTQQVQYNAQLLREAQAGDGTALENLMQRFKRLVKAKASAYYLVGGDRDDIIQEGMIGLYKAIRDYDEDKNASFYAFADLCVSRQIMSAIKASARRKHQPLNNSLPLDEPPETEDLTATGCEGNPEALLIDREASNDFGSLLRRHLSGMEYRVMILYLQGMGHGDIARALDKNKKSIDNTLQRARKKMEKVVRK